MEQSALCVDYSDNYGSLRGLVSDNFLHAGVVGDTIVGINPLSSVLSPLRGAADPNLRSPLHSHDRTSTSTTGVQVHSIIDQRPAAGRSGRRSNGRPVGLDAAPSNNPLASAASEEIFEIFLL